MPTVKQAIPAEGEMIIGNKIALSFHKDFASEGKLLKEKLENIYGLKVTTEAKESILLEYLPEDKEVPNDEYYELDINNRQAIVKSQTSHGIFNGTQTLLAMLKGQGETLRLQAVSVHDYPDLLYRGQMLDIVRSFTTTENLKKLRSKP